MADGGKFAPVLDDPLQQIVNVHWGKHPCVLVFVTCGAGGNPVPTILGGEGTVELSNLTTFNSGAPGVAVSYIVNLTSYKVGLTKVICNPGIGGVIPSDMLQWNIPITDGVDTTLPENQSKLQIRYYLGDQQDHPYNSDGTPNGNWAGYVVVDYAQVAENDGELLPSNVGFSCWPYNETGNDELPGAASAQIIAQWSTILRFLAAGGGLSSPPPLSWIPSDTGGFSVDTRINMEVYNGRVLNGPINSINHPGVQGYFTWPAVKQRKPTDGSPDPPQTSKTLSGDDKTEAQVLHDTVLTQANPITANSFPGQRNDNDPEVDVIGLGFRLQAEAIRATGFDSYVLAANWNKRDHEDKTAVPPDPGVLKEGSSYDQWELFFDEQVAPFNDPPGPDPVNSQELDKVF